MIEKPLEQPAPNAAIADVLRRCESAYTGYSKTAMKYREQGRIDLYEYYKGKAHGFMLASDLLYEAGARWRHPL
jgi:hypothetical protein